MHIPESPDLPGGGELAGDWVRVPCPDPPTKDSNTAPSPSPSPSTGAIKAFSTPGYSSTIFTGNGLTGPIFTTPYGTIKVNLPEGFQPDQPFQGSVWMDPTGATDKDKSKNRDQLLNTKIFLLFDPTPRFVDLTPIWPNDTNAAVPPQRLSSFNWLHGLDAHMVNDLRVKASIGVGIADSHGKPLVSEPVKVSGSQPLIDSNPRPLDSFMLPTGGQMGGIFMITGPFAAGAFPGTTVRIDDSPLPVLAGSTDSLAFWDIGARAPGIGYIKLDTGGKTYTCPYNNIQVQLTAGSTNLLRGQSTELKVIVLGLMSLKNDVPFELQNNTPGTISMTGGNDQKFIIHPGDVGADGTFTTTRKLTGVTPGNFNVLGTATWDGTCKAAAK